MLRPCMHMGRAKRPPSPRLWRTSHSSLSKPSSEGWVEAATGPGVGGAASVVSVYRCKRRTFAPPPSTYCAHCSMSPRRLSNRSDLA